MITTSSPQARSRIFEIGLVLSILTHLLVLLVYLGVFARIAPFIQPKPPDEMVATSDVIRLEKRTVPRPTVKSNNVPRPQPVPPQPRVAVRRPPPPPAPLTKPVEKAPKPVPRHEIARPVPRAPAQPQAAPTAVAVAPPKQVSLSQAAPAPRSTSDEHQQAAQPAQQQEQRYRDIIAQTNKSLQNFTPDHQSPSAIRQRPLEMPGVTFEDLQHAEGIVTYVYREGTDGNYNWHIIRVTIQYPDGFTETVDVPWPFVFPRNNDPIAFHSRRPFAAQGPPPGFALKRPFAPSRFVCGFYPTECQQLFDAERRSGGLPAAAN